MITRKHLMIALVAALPAWAAWAEGSTSTNTNPNLFPVTFFAFCQSLNSTNGQIVQSKITSTDIIAQALGLGPGQATIVNGFTLAYNASQDSLQVVNTNQPGTVVDVLHFGGGAAFADSRQLDRFTFLFFPGQTNQLGVETNVIGSALITERAAGSGNTNASGNPMITGRLQYVLTGGNVLGQTNTFGPTAMTNSASGTNGTNMVTSIGTVIPGPGFVMTNANINFDPTAQICVGFFTTGQGHGHGSGMGNFNGANTNSPGMLPGTNGIVMPGSTNSPGSTGP